MNDPDNPLPGASGITAERLQAELPQFEVGRLLGAGGMGAVFEAWQPRLKRQVAIKVLTLDGAEGPYFMDRFKREAHAMARLQHKRIIAIYDTGVTGGGWPFIIMEYVDGATLHALRREAGRLPPDRVLLMMIQICEALHYAHGQGIVHRDIKPANIMLDTSGCVKIADFGLAKMLDNGPGNIALTRPNAVMGTMAYMAPEQLMALPDLDARADIYALGVMLYEFLTGKLPRGAWSSPSDLVDGLDPRFDQIVGRALLQDRDARYQNVVEMWQALLEINDTPMEAIVPEPQEMPPLAPPATVAGNRKTPPVAGRRPAAFPRVAATLAGLLIVAALAWFIFRPPPPGAGIPPPAAIAPSLPVPTPALAKPPETAANTTLPPPSTQPGELTGVETAPPPAIVPPPASAPRPESGAVPLAVPPGPVSGPAPVAENTPATAPEPTRLKAPSPLAVHLAPLRQRYLKEVATGYADSVRTLNTNYARALTNAMAEATTKGDLEAVVAIRGERDQLSQSGDKPLPDLAAIPASLITLRKTYTSTLSGYQRQRDRPLASIFIPELRRLLHSHAAGLARGKDHPAVISMRAFADRLATLPNEILHKTLLDPDANSIAAMAARRIPGPEDPAAGKLHGAGVSYQKNFTFAPGDAWPWFLKAPARTVRLWASPGEVLAADREGTLSGREFTQTIPTLNRGIVDASLAYGGNLFIHGDGRVSYTGSGASLFATAPPKHLDLAAVKDAVSVVASNQHFGLLHGDGRLDLWTRDGTGTKALPVPADAGDVVRLYVTGWEKPCLFGQRLDGSFIPLVPEEATPSVTFLNAIREPVVSVQCSSFANHLLALTESGKVHAWQTGDEQGAAAVPEDLGPATEIRIGKWLSAARVAGGRWRAWGSNRYGLVNRINALSPAAYDLVFHDWDTGTGQLFWLEP